MFIMRAVAEDFCTDPGHILQGSSNHLHCHSCANCSGEKSSGKEHSHGTTARRAETNAPPGLL